MNLFCGCLITKICCSDYGCTDANEPDGEYAFTCYDPLAHSDGGLWQTLPLEICGEHSCGNRHLPALYIYPFQIVRHCLVDGSVTVKIESNA